MNLLHHGSQIINMLSNICHCWWRIFHSLAYFCWLMRAFDRSGSLETILLMLWVESRWILCSYCLKPVQMTLHFIEWAITSSNWVPIIVYIKIQIIKYKTNAFWTYSFSIIVNTRFGSIPSSKHLALHDVWNLFFATTDSWSAWLWSLNCGALLRTFPLRNKVARQVLTLQTYRL